MAFFYECKDAGCDHRESAFTDAMRHAATHQDLSDRATVGEVATVIHVPAQMARKVLDLPEDQQAAAWERVLDTRRGQGSFSGNPQVDSV